MDEELKTEAPVRLEVLICTLGESGIERVCRAGHPRVEGVRYIVSWQLPDGDRPVPPELAMRDDFRVVRHNTYGLCRNRNAALRNAFAPIVLISDDDISYTEEGLRNILRAFDEHPDIDFMAFRHVESDGSSPRKRYPRRLMPLDQGHRGYHIVSFEMAWRNNVLKENKIWFNEWFGIGSPLFHSGEETVLLHDVLSHGIPAAFVPEVICRNVGGATTGSRGASDPNFAMTQGAIINLTHRFTSWPRYMLDALRNLRRGRHPILPLRFFFLELKGARRARRMHVFKR